MKVFGIGFHKTATKSLGHALAMLGYRVCGPVGVNDPEVADKVWSLVEPRLQECDAFQDNPWPLLYRELDRRFPGSKFILTLRPEQEWLASVVGHFGDQETPMRRWIYGPGAPRGHEQTYLDRYRRHNAEVMEYFSARPDDLLVLRITEGEGWEKLCPFLECQVPDQAFPLLNTKDARLDQR